MHTYSQDNNTICKTEEAFKMIETNVLNVIITKDNFFSNFILLKIYMLCS